MPLRIKPGHAGAAGLTLAVVAGDMRNLVTGAALTMHGDVTTRVSPVNGKAEWVFATNADFLQANAGQPLHDPEQPTLAYCFVANWTQSAQPPTGGNECLFSAYAPNHGNTLWLQAGWQAGTGVIVQERGRRYQGGAAFQVGSGNALHRWGVKLDASSTLLERYAASDNTGLAFNNSGLAYTDRGDIYIGQRYDDQSWGCSGCFQQVLLVWGSATQPSDALFRSLTDNPWDLFEEEPAAAVSGGVTGADGVAAGSISQAGLVQISGGITAQDGVAAGSIAGGASSTVATLPFTRNPGNGGRLASLPNIAVAVLADDANLARLAGSPALAMASDGRVTFANGVPVPAGTSVIVVTREPGGAGALGVDRRVTT